MNGVTLPTETVFVMEMSPIKFGLGATDEIGFDAARLGLRKVLIFTDRNLAAAGLPERVRGLLEEQGVKADVYDGVEVEPTDRSMEDAAEYARTKEFDGLVAVGGGSTIDTCKAANLLTCHPAPLLDYINKPVGKGIAVPGPLRPLIAVPTTAGTGSETTAVAVTHVLDQNVKAGVSHRLLRPALGVVDPINTLTAPPEVTAAAGADILTHAIESYTTRPYNARAKHHPPDRPAYIGANPASDVWCEKAVEYVARYLRRAVLNGLDLEARVNLALAANYAGHRLRQCRRAHPARARLPHRRARARLRPAGLSHAARHGAARHGGHPVRPRRVPLHLRDGARPPSPRRRADGRAGERARRRPSAARPCPARSSPSCATPAFPTG